MPTPTVVPTIVPVSGAPVSPSNPSLPPTPVGSLEQTPESSSQADWLGVDANLLKAAGLAVVCCLVVLALVAVIVLIVRSRRGRSI
jgi:hypothetical protein